jgi:hypothetical protein
MATRNSVARVIPGNPLGSILRETAREARRTSRRSTGTPGEPGETGPQGPPGSPGVARVQYTTTVVSGATGLFTWTYPAPFTGTPFLYATVVDSSPRWVSVYLPNSTSTQGYVWDFATGTGIPGITVNLLAISPV